MFTLEVSVMLLDYCFKSTWAYSLDLPNNSVIQSENTCTSSDNFFANDSACIQEGEGTVLEHVISLHFENETCR